MLLLAQLKDMYVRLTADFKWAVGMNVLVLQQIRDLSSPTASLDQICGRVWVNGYTYNHFGGKAKIFFCKEKTL